MILWRMLKRFYSGILLPIFKVLQITLRNYQQDQALRLAAALAYYTIFSLPAIIIVLIGFVGALFGEAAVQGEIYKQIVDVVGGEAALQIQNAVKSLGNYETNWWAMAAGFGVLAFVATGVFYVMQETLNRIFQVQLRPRKVQFRLLQMLVNRVISLLMVVSLGGLLIVSVILNAVLLKFTDFVMLHKPWIMEKLSPKLDFLIPYLDYFTGYFFVFLNLGVSIFLIALFFASLYRILPAVRLKWRYIWAGAFFAAVLFWFGQLLMGYYLSYTSIVSAYGAAGSLIVILIWVYYSSQLIFLGAEFIRALCEYRGISIKPTRFARKLAKAGIRKVIETTEGHVIVELEKVSEKEPVVEKSEGLQTQETTIEEPQELEKEILETPIPEEKELPENPDVTNEDKS